MLRVDDVHARLEAQVPELGGNLGSAGQFASLVERRQLPSWRVGAFVLPGTITGGQVRSANAAAFIQDIEETIIVVLVVRVASDPKSSKALDEITPFVRKVVGGLIGWGPADAPGTFALTKGELVGSQDSALIYQLDFALQDQLRKIG